MTQHFKFGGSTAGRTVACPSWVNLSENMPSGPPSRAALEGTLMHLLFEQGIQDPDFEPAVGVGQSTVIEGVTLTCTAEHVDKVYTAYDLQAQIEDKYGLDVVLPEMHMSTDEDTGGTADIVAWSNPSRSTVRDLKVFAVGDLKTGDGHMVQAKDNEQLLFYAWQAYERFRRDFNFTDDTVFVLYIIQPSERRDDPLDIWETSLKNVLRFAAKFKQAQKAARNGIKAPCPSAHCKYCPAAPVCPAKTGMIAVQQRIPAKSTELADLIKALNMVDEVEDWCRAVRKTAHEQLEAGVQLPGFKLVQKRATRQWVSEQDIATTLKRMRGLVHDDYTISKIKSPAQLEAVCKQKGVDFTKFESMIHLQSSGTTLVKDSDSRQAVLPLNRLASMAATLK